MTSPAPLYPPRSYGAPTLPDPQDTIYDAVVARAHEQYESARAYKRRWVRATNRATWLAIVLGLHLAADVLLVLHWWGSR